jgi:hypothetical protein
MWIIRDSQMVALSEARVQNALDRLGAHLRIACPRETFGWNDEQLRGEVLRGVEHAKRQFAGITLQPGRSQFVPVPNNKQLASAVHECGHAMGMVATTAQQGLTHAHHYDFNANHCWTSVAGPAGEPADYHRIPLKDTGTCVMYGLIPDAGPNLAFCADCSSVLRKLDLTRGFTG